MGSGAARSGEEAPSKISERAVMAGQDEDRILIAFPYCCVVILSKLDRTQSLKIGGPREPSVLLVILVFRPTSMAESFEVLSAGRWTSRAAPQHFFPKKANISEHRRT